MKFSSSGREDVDVRCIGSGRPFYIEIDDPKRTEYKPEEFRHVEELINKSELINVRDFQMVNKNDLQKIKEGEETKTKRYTALCKSDRAITEDDIFKLNNMGVINLRQKTPIRVLHRRPVAVRDKIVHEMKAEIVPSN